MSPRFFAAHGAAKCNILMMPSWCLLRDMDWLCAEHHESFLEDADLLRLMREEHTSLLAERVEQIRAIFK